MNLPPPEPAIHVQARLSDEAYLKAISQIESGDNDSAVGLHGERSRYQIKPLVWHRYTPSQKFTDPDVARFIARKHLRHIRAILAGGGVRETPKIVGMFWRLGETRCYPIFQGKHIIMSDDEHSYCERFANLINAK